jgi:tetratricopeptide (TPR) repeat protein
MDDKQPPLKNINEQSDIKVGGNYHQGDVVNNYLNTADPKPMIPHQLTNNIPLNADHILGREAELQAVITHLAQNKKAVLVNGVGGIGKTSVATKYVALYGHQYAHIAWLTVQSSMAEAFTSHKILLEALNLTEKVEKLIESKQLGAAFELIVYHLNQLGNTLVVIDNANNLADLVEYKHLFDTAQCHFLLTSRNTPQAWQIVPIEHLPKAEALNVFKKWAPSVFASDEALLTVLDRLFFHTLLIELVAKSVQASAIDFETLQKIIQDKFIHDETLSRRKVETGGHGDSVDSNAKRAKVQEYIGLIFQNISQISEHAQTALKAMTLLPSAMAFEDDYLAAHLKDFGLNEDVYELLDGLVEWGWLESTREKGKPAYKMHPLIADVVVQQLAVDAAFAEDYTIRVAELIYYDTTNPKHNLFAINENKYLAERLSNLFFDENTEGVSRLLDSLGGLEDEFGFYHKSVEYKKQALIIAENIFPKNHYIIPVRQNNLANVYRNLGKSEEGIILLEKALESDILNLGKDHTNVAIRQSNLALLYQDLGKYNEAEVLLETALENAEQSYKDIHPIIAVRQSNLATIYHYLGKYNKSAALLETALASNIKNFGNDHPSVANDQSNLATVYMELNRHKEACVLLELALKSNVKSFGKNHPRIATNESNLAISYQNLGRYKESEFLYKKAIENAQTNFGENHHFVTRHQSNLATLYKEMGMCNEASLILNSVLLNNIEILGKEHPDVALNKWNLATVYIDLDRKPEAKVLLQEAYQTMLKSLGAEHPHTITVQTWFPFAE